MRGAHWKCDFWYRRQCRHLARGVAVAAIGMDLGHFVGIVWQVGLRVMLMRVVAEVLRALFPFVLAIRGPQLPGKLERKQ